MLISNIILYGPGIKLRNIFNDKEMINNDIKSMFIFRSDLIANNASIIIT